MTSKRVCHPDPVVKPQLQCPYNPAHFLYEERFQRHLITCAKSNPEIAAKMTACPFNQTHIVPKTKLMVHTQECPDKKIVATPNANSEQVVLRELAKPLGTIAACEEDWENEVNETTYDPSKRIAQLAIAPVPSGMKPSERKEFRNKTRVILGSATGNLPEGAEVPKDTTFTPLPYQPTGGRGRGRPAASSAPSVGRPAGQEIRPPVKIMAVSEVPKPKTKKIAASFSGPVQPAQEAPPRSIGRGRLVDNIDDFPPLGPAVGAGRGRPGPPPGFEGHTPSMSQRLSALQL